MTHTVLLFGLMSACTPDARKEEREDTESATPEPEDTGAVEGGPKPVPLPGFDVSLVGFRGDTYEGTEFRTALGTNDDWTFLLAVNLDVSETAESGDYTYGVTEVQADDSVTPVAYTGHSLYDLYCGYREQQTVTTMWQGTTGTLVLHLGDSGSATLDLADVLFVEQSSGEEVLVEKFSSSEFVFEECYIDGA